MSEQASKAAYDYVTDHGEGPAIFGTARGFRAECVCGWESRVVGTQLLAHRRWLKHREPAGSTGLVECETCWRLASRKVHDEAGECFDVCRECAEAFVHDPAPRPALTVPYPTPGVGA